MFDHNAIRFVTHRVIYALGGRQSNPGHPARQVIGTYQLSKDREYNESYEVAAWWSKLLVKAGDYEITTNGYYAFVKLPGVIVSKYTPGLYGGVAFGSTPQYEKHKDVGNESSHMVMPYLYSAAELFADPDSNWIPNDNVEPVLSGWTEHKWSNDRYASPMFNLIIH